MAQTFPKQSLRPLALSRPYAALIERRRPEGASQTFPAGSPLKASSGLLVVFVNPTDAKLAAWSLEAGHNNSGSEIACVLASMEVGFEANFLGSAAADNVLAAADVDSANGFDLASSSTLIGGTDAGWYLVDATADPVARITDLHVSVFPGNNTSSVAAVGDTNARVRCTVDSGVLLST